MFEEGEKWRFFSTDWESLLQVQTHVQLADFWTCQRHAIIYLAVWTRQNVEDVCESREQVWVQMGSLGSQFYGTNNIC